jgi:hypothetical protein
MIASTSQQILELGLKNLRASIIQRSTEAGQRASGRTYESIQAQNITATHGELVGPVWVAVLEDGRRPGPVPFNFYEIIMEWATFKGISWASADPITFERWAKGVAWNIRRFGTELYRSGQKLDIFETPIAEFERWLFEQLKVFYATEISNTLRTAWQNR